MMKSKLYLLAICILILSSLMLVSCAKSGPQLNIIKPDKYVLVREFPYEQFG